MSNVRERDEDIEQSAPSPKRTKLDNELDDVVVPLDVLEENDAMDTKEDYVSEEKEPESLLPPSHAFLNTPPPVYTSDGLMQKIMETDVGISEYIGKDVPTIEGIIKQRFTDFLVYEVDLDGNVIHLKSLERPESAPGKNTKKDTEATPETQTPNITENDSTLTQVEPKGETTFIPQIEQGSSSIEQEDIETKKEEKKAERETEPWPERFNDTLRSFLSEEVISQVKALYLEGPEPPFVSDSGWGGRAAQTVAQESEGSSSTAQPAQEPDSEVPDRGKRGRDRDGRGGRGGGGGRGGRGGRGEGRTPRREDHRKVLSDPISSKETRTGLHQAIRELFNGKIDTESAPSTDDGARIIIKWSKRGGGGRGRGGRSDRGGRSGRGERGDYPPYIHFTLQKTNRDTQDALAHISRALHCEVKDLSVAGTKDKRGVTVQRVSLRRGNKTVEDVWRLINGLNNRRPAEDVLTKRGDRGIRAADFNYRKASLELGMLKGNAFVITLRNVQVDSIQTLDRAMNTIKTKGFINYYGMQRFGTAAIPTHTIGLALLKSEWQKAIDLILRVRPGEHPEVTAARNAWLIDGDLERALELMPRRVVAERCILESYKKQKGETRNAMGALSTIPRNLRLMYVHAYQSYVWNAIVSERIRIYGAEKPVVGDLVFDTDKGNTGEDDKDIALDGDENEESNAEKAADEEEEISTSNRQAKRSRKPWEPAKVKILAEADLDKYTIFDVIMPLPGRDVALPGSKLGERYREFLEADGLDPDNFVRKQKEYSLGGSYRKILHLPKELSWSVLRYTDPDVALAQADEDKLLGFDPPQVDEGGRFMALQIQLQLGTAAYATMALREVTKTETSSHFQTGLTQASEDQKYKAAGDASDVKPEGDSISL